MTLAVEPPQPGKLIETTAPLRESSLERWIYFFAAMLLIVLLGAGLFRSYWVPAHMGLDQNGYLVGGKNIARTLTMRYAPQVPGDARFDPHQFVSRMWVGAGFGTEQERFYPKYPLGFPFLVAIALWIGGAKYGIALAYAINPIASMLTLVATFLLLRRFVSSFWAFCGMLICASSPMLLGLATNPNSHASGTCCTTWGIYLLLRWWQRGGLARAAGAGYLLGYAATIRYTDGLLILPIALVLLINWRGWRQGWAAALGWCVPVGILVSYNLAAMGHVTGYDGTHESSGFSFAYAADNWDTLLKQMGGIGLYGIFPLALVGVIAMVARQWRTGVVLAAWVVPPLLLYTAYYWAPDPLQQNGAYLPYLRFFATITPGLTLGAIWLFDQICKATPGVLVQVCCGTLVLLPVAVQLQLTTESAEADTEARRAIKENADHVLADAPAGAVLFAPEGSQQQLLQHLQFAGDYVLYTSDTFNKGFIDGLLNEDPNDPQGWDPSIRVSLHDRLGKFSQAQLDEQARQIVSMSLRNGRRVFFLLSRNNADPSIKPRHAKADVNKPAFGGEPGSYLKRFAPDSMYDDTPMDAWTTAAPAATLNQPLRGQHRHDRPGHPGESRWQLVEVTEKSPTPPATKPK